MIASEREGVAGIALLAMFADGVIAAEEDELLRERLLAYPLFQDLDDEGLGEVLERLERRSSQVGAGKLLDECVGAIGPRLAPTAYLLAAEIVAADGEVAPEEDAFLARLRKGLGLPDANARAIHDVLAIRARS